MAIHTFEPEDQGTINEAWQKLMQLVGVRRSDFEIATTVNDASFNLIRAK